jgi:hypothetical protein
MDKQGGIDKKQISMAGRVWCIQSFKIADKPSSSLYTESARTPQEGYVYG